MDVLSMFHSYKIETIDMGIPKLSNVNQFLKISLLILD